MECNPYFGQLAHFFGEVLHLSNRGVPQLHSQGDRVHFHRQALACFPGLERENTSNSATETMSREGESGEAAGS